MRRICGTERSIQRPFQNVSGVECGPLGWTEPDRRGTDRTMTQTSDPRPVGAILEDWVAPKPPGPDVIEGDSVRLERLDPARHGPALFKALGQVPKVWTYLPMPPFRSETDLVAHLAEVTADPKTHVFYAILPRHAGGPQGFSRIIRSSLPWG